MSLQIGTCTSIRGELTVGSLPFGELSDGSSCAIPMMILSGREAGPTLFVSAAVHGTELVGVEIVRRLLREVLDPQGLRGTIVAAPIANPLAFRAASYTTPEDLGNPHHTMPGRPDGNLTQRLAHALAHEVVRHADAVVDIHTNPAPYLSFSALSRVPSAPAGAYERSVELAEAFGLTIVERPVSQVWQRHMAEYVQGQGKPCVAVHFEGYHRFDEACVAAGVQGCRNVLSRLGMTDGAVTPPKGLKIIPGRVYRDDRCDLRASRGGLLHAALEPGQEIVAGEVLARVYDPWGVLLEEIVSPLPGVYLGLRPGKNQAVYSGEIAVAMGVLEPPG